jgi:hypothetical protein
MAKRDQERTRANGGTATADTLEQRVVAFAEQLGRIAGTLHAKAEGWLDREALTKQIASVRDSAAELLEQLADGATKDSKRTPVATAALGKTKGRSGGVVDAPGKKHRKPMRTDSGANMADSQAAKMRMARTMVKTHRRRGRG